MHSEKARRHQAVLELLDRELISNQEDLRTRLFDEGFDVTQATLSRDLKELGVVKSVSEAGMYKYARRDSVDGIPIISCQKSGNILVMRTSAGMAPAAAYRIDSYNMPEVLGTVAGEDTLFVVVAEGVAVDSVKDRLWQRLRGRLQSL